MGDTINHKMTVDSLFPCKNNVSGKKGKKINVSTLFKGSALSSEPVLDYSSSVLIARREKRREVKLKHYNVMLKYCWDKIYQMDENGESDLFFNVVDQIAECKEYSPIECMEFISRKLRDESIDTVIMGNNMMFITWEYIELKNTSESNNSKEKQK